MSKLAQRFPDKLDIRIAAGRPTEHYSMPMSSWPKVWLRKCLYSHCLLDPTCQKAGH